MIKDINLNDFDYNKLENSRQKYIKLNNVMQDIFNDKSKLVFAFGRNEKEILETLEKEYNLTIENIVSIGYGGYLHKNDVKQFNNLNKYIKGIKKEFVKDYYNCCGLYLNSLWNYECRYSNDYSDAMNDLKYYLGVNDLMELDNTLLKMLELTEKYYNKEFDKYN